MRYPEHTKINISTTRMVLIINDAKELEHSVEVNVSNRICISVSFNHMFSG